MRILNPINFITSIGADRWIGSGLKDAFEDLGHEVFWLPNADDLKTKIEEVKPDIVFIGMERLLLKEVPVLLAARKRGIKIVVAVSSVFDENAEFIQVIKRYDVADLYRGETEKPWMKRFEEVTGRNYATTANAAHERYHFPTAPVDKYKCDIVFMGANLPLKKQLFEKLLFPLRKKYDVKLFGPNWTLYDNTLRTAAYASRRLGFMKLNDWFSRARVSVPIEEENQLYSSAKICINIHEERTGVSADHVILNERAFKIPACGGFQIIDFVPPREVIDKYFTIGKEIVYAESVDDWYQKIDYYLKHDGERQAIQKRGIERALRDHLYTNRVKELFALLNAGQ